MPRPRIGDRVHFVISPRLDQALLDQVERTGYTKSEVIRRLLTAAITQPDLVARFLPAKPTKDKR